MVRPVRVTMTRRGCVVTSGVAVVVVSVGCGSTSESLSTVGRVAGNWSNNVCWRSRSVMWGRIKSLNSVWVILLNLVHTRYFQFLAIFHNVAGNEHGFFGQN